MPAASFARAAALVGVSVVLAGVPIDALAGQECGIDPHSPRELATISAAFERARALPAGPPRTAALRNVLRDLDTRTDRFAKNQVGYDYVLSQALSLASLEPGVGLHPTRGQLGFTTGADQPYDLVMSLDRLFSAMASAAPTCVAEVRLMRAGEVWLALTRRALEASNAGELDSAEYYAKRSMTLSSTSPYPHHVLATVANARKDRAGAIAHWRHVIELSAGDTALADLRVQSMYYVAMNELDAARAASGDARVAAARQAAGSFREFMARAPTGTDMTLSISALAEAYAIAGDSAQLPSVYRPLLERPGDYDDNALTMAGVIATQAGHVDEALLLFQAAVKRNPMARDALRNLAATYLAKEQYREMSGPLDALKAIDPNNVDAWLMYAYAMQGLQKTAVNAAQKKLLTDSMVKYSAIADGLPVKVEVLRFARGVDGAELDLALEQAAAGTGNYTVQVEFLDAAGDVVAQDSAKVGPVASGSRATVTLKVQGAGIIAYRYKPLM